MVNRGTTLITVTYLALGTIVCLFVSNRAVQMLLLVILILTYTVALIFYREYRWCHRSYGNWRS